MTRARAILAAIAVMALTASAFAAVDDAKVFVPGASSSASAPSAGLGLGSMTMVIGLALAGVGGWLVWRARNGAPITREARQLNIQETRSLGNRQFLVVATYENQKFLLGVCPGRIEMLTPLASAADDEDLS
jgi:flagellar protein FliO/FliZ